MGYIDIVYVIEILLSIFANIFEKLLDKQYSGTAWKFNQRNDASKLNNMNKAWGTLTKNY